MEELSARFKALQVQRNAELVSKALRLPFTLARLAPVSVADCLGGEYACIVGKMGPKKISIGSDPVNIWFNLHEELQV